MTFAMAKAVGIKAKVEILSAVGQLDDWMHSQGVHPIGGWEALEAGDDDVV